MKKIPVIAKGKDEKGLPKEWKGETFQFEKLDEAKRELTEEKAVKLLNQMMVLVEQRRLRMGAKGPTLAGILKKATPDQRSKIEALLKAQGLL